MKPINQFLKSQLDTFSEDVLKVDDTKGDIENLNRQFLIRSKSNHSIRHLKIKPRVQRGQIWTVKNEYDDFQGITQNTSHPFIVLVNNDPDDIEGEGFVRVLVVSPFIEMANNNDEVCNDASIIGFPFLIETWNDQPLLTEILDEYIGYYEIQSTPTLRPEVYELVNEPLSNYGDKKAELISKTQTDFRDIEIARAKYINHSVRSLLSFLENRQSQDAGVVISVFNNPEYPKFYIGQSQKEPTYALAARSGIDNEDKYLLFENVNIPFRLFIRKNENGFILSVDSTEKMQLFKSTIQEFVGLSNNERTVFSDLQAGNYSLLVETIKQPIKIRLK
ncbi:MAG: hypothetical protein H3C36_09755 [Chitinophagaceae bacterium]|nr:hypothetical protein [Chitinophagaceae bacterium]MCW5914713.1 hypothetical protein [Chitinophagaceae bacterium]